MKVREDLTDGEWESLALASEHSTFFHTPAWARSVEKTFPGKYRAKARLFQFAPGDWALLPAMETERELRGFFRTLNAGVLGVYGGCVASQPLTGEKFQRIAAYLQRIRVKRVVMFGNPYAPAATLADHWALTPNYTHQLPLSGFQSETELLGAYTHMMRNHVNRASRIGYDVQIARSESDVADYAQVYEKSLERHGENATGRQPRELFFHLFRTAPGNAAFWIARRDGRAVGGVLVFYYRRRAIAWNAAFAAEEFPNGIAKFLHHQVIVNARDNGFQVYDFNPSGGHEGTVKFKEMFGAERRDFAGYLWVNGFYRAYKRVRTLLPTSSR